jgi:hypothetical protein
MAKKLMKIKMYSLEPASHRILEEYKRLELQVITVPILKYMDMYFTGWCFLKRGSGKKAIWRITKRYIYRNLNYDGRWISYRSRNL